MKRRLIFALIDLIELRDYYYTQTSESRQSYFLFLIATNLLKPCLPATRLPFPLIIFRLWCLAAARGEQRRVERERVLSLSRLWRSRAAAYNSYFISTKIYVNIYTIYKYLPQLTVRCFANLYLLVTTISNIYISSMSTVRTWRSRVHHVFLHGPEISTPACDHTETAPATIKFIHRSIVNSKTPPATRRLL